MGGANTYAVNNTIVKDGLTVEASEGGEVEYTDGSGFTLKTNGAYEITGTWNGDLTGVDYDNKKAVITVPNGVTADVTLSDVTITKVSSTDFACAFAVAGDGTANITLSGTNTLSSGRYRAGMEAPESAEVAIDGSGSLTANGGEDGAGIGGGSGGGSGLLDAYGGDGGQLTIDGNAVVFATSKQAAPIGSGPGGSDGTKTLTKGVVFEGGMMGRFTEVLNSPVI